MNPLYPVVAVRAGYRCEYCGVPEAVFNFPFEVEHITPRSRGGADLESNAALACRACNLRKADHVSGMDEETGQDVRLFHPRQDRWEDHFQILLADATIHGLTPIGRATVAQLEFNSEAQVAARKLWLRLDIFPQR